MSPAETGRAAVGLLHQLTSNAVLLPVGVSLGFTGIILRGFARSSRRERERRKQHRLHHEKLLAATGPDASTGWLEKHLSLIANTTAIAGLVITLVALFRK